MSKAMKELGVKNGTIVSWMDESASAGGMEVVPAWKWLTLPQNT